MSGELLNGGEPIVVTTPRDRIGHGPWARLLVTAVLPNEGSSVAERGRALARGGNVHSVSVGSGTISARVVGDDGARVRSDVHRRIRFRRECGPRSRCRRDATSVSPRRWQGASSRCISSTSCASTGTSR